MDISRLDLNLLLVFDALYDEQSVSVAAQRLKQSQPTVSFSLRKLRDFFGDQLFLRTRAGMKPTPFAQGLRPAVHDMIDIIQHRILAPAVFDPATTARTFTISTSDIGELCFLPWLIDALERFAPNARLQSLSLPPAELAAALERGEVDLATGHFPDLDGAAFRRQQLFSHPFQCLVRSGHPLAAKKMTLDGFLNAEHAVVVQKGRSQELAERTMAELGLERHVLLQSPNFMSLPFLIARSDLVTIAPRAVGTSFAPIGGLMMLPPPFPIPDIALAQHWHQRFDSDPAVTWLRTLVSDLFLDRDPTDPLTQLPGLLQPATA